MGEKETATAGRAFQETDDPEPAEGIVKSKSNITNNREEAETGERASNLNLSKSNRSASPAGPEPSEATKLNPSKSN